MPLHLLSLSGELAYYCPVATIIIWSQLTFFVTAIFYFIRYSFYGLDKYISLLHHLFGAFGSVQFCTGIMRLVVNSVFLTVSP